MHNLILFSRRLYAHSYTIIDTNFFGKSFSVPWVFDGVGLDGDEVGREGGLVHGENPFESGGFLLSRPKNDIEIDTQINAIRDS